MQEGNYSYLIADAEKAICDKLYTLSPASNIKELEYILFNDLRIEEDEFYKLDKEKMSRFAKLYRSTNLDLLVKLLRRKNNDYNRSDAREI